MDASEKILLLRIMHLYPEYDYLFLFDHSSGYDKQRKDGLNVKKKTRSDGGLQQKMRDTLIKQRTGLSRTLP